MCILWYFSGPTFIFYLCDLFNDSRIGERSVGNELEWTWKEAVVVEIEFLGVISSLCSVNSNIWYMIWYDTIYLLTAIGLPPGGSCTVHIYTQTIHRTTQNKQYIEQHKHFGRVRAVPRLCELYPGICLTTEEKARKTLSQGSRTIRIHKLNNKNI
jgi:hypothetical protein